MTTFNTIKDHPCAICGAKHDQQVLCSTNQFGSSDLDGRPSEMARSAMKYWVQTCPNCGYCAKDLSNSDQNCKDIVKSATYQQQLNNPSFPTLANKFLCEAMICQTLGQYLIAAKSCIYAVWCCDDGELIKEATFCRNKAIDLIQKAIPRQQLDQRYKVENEVLIDLLRRAGRFSEAAEIVEVSLASGSFGFGIAIKKREGFFCKVKRDASTRSRQRTQMSLTRSLTTRSPLASPNKRSRFFIPRVSSRFKPINNLLGRRRMVAI